jgi:hypothetical protein
MGIQNMLTAGQNAVAPMTDTLHAISSLPIQFLRDALNLRFPQRFRQVTPRNTQGCWFMSEGQGGGYQQRQKADGTWAEHRNAYQQINWDATPVPAGANPNGPWKMRAGIRVIGCQPRYVSTLKYDFIF